MQTGRTILPALVLLLGSLAAVPAWAFHIDDHIAITRVAMNQVWRCEPDSRGRLTPAALEEIIDANMGEDLNLIRKWIHYSHYYNPYKTIDMYRADSSATVDEAQSALESSTRDDSDTNLWLGRAAHHIQDANVPSHVEPVEHGMSDGFESLGVSLDSHLEIPCAQLKSGLPPTLLDLLRETAIHTDAALDQKISYSSAGTARGTEISWRQGFWSASSDNSFGSYGFFGNGFGDASLTFEDARGTTSTAQIAPEEYVRFKTKQMTQAVRATAQVMLWYLNRITR